MKGFALYLDEVHRDTLSDRINSYVIKNRDTLENQADLIDEIRDA
jgi:hypothetical protein